MEREMANTKRADDLCSKQLKQHNHVAPKTEHITLLNGKVHNGKK